MEPFAPRRPRQLCWSGSEPCPEDEIFPTGRFQSETAMRPMAEWRGPVLSGLHIDVPKRPRGYEGLTSMLALWRGDLLIAGRSSDRVGGAAGGWDGLVSTPPAASLGHHSVASPKLGLKGKKCVAWRRVLPLGLHETHRIDVDLHLEVAFGLFGARKPEAHITRKIEILA